MSIKERAIETLDIEGKAVLALKDRIGDEFVAAVNCILRCPARVVVTGMGKSGHVGRKIAATLASTGTPSFFLHPAEAFHGDLGMVTENDVVRINAFSKPNRVCATLFVDNVLAIATGEDIGVITHTTT